MKKGSDFGLARRLNEAARFFVAFLCLCALGACAAAYGERRLVERGETIESIARKAGVSARAVRELNYLGPEDRVAEGDIIFLPAPEENFRAEPAQAVSPSKTAPGKDEKSAPKSPARVAKVQEPGQSAVPAIKSKVLPPLASKPAEPAGKNLRLAWPAEGRVLRKFGGEGGKGVEISTKSGETVKASAGGLVNYAGLPARAYGTMAIIDHGGDFYTVYSNMTSLKVRTGDRVAAGEAVGSAGEFLHFEVRKGTAAQDPLLYLPDR